MKYCRRWAGWTTFIASFLHQRCRGRVKGQNNLVAQHRERMQSMGVSAPAIGRYRDALEGGFMLHSLQPMEANVMKRMVKSPKVYVRDSGLLLALLDVRTEQQLTGHPVAGALWEGVVIEQLIGAKPPTVQANFYRTARGAAQQSRSRGDRVQVLQRSEARARVS